MVKYKYDTLDNLPGEVLTDICALADQFLIALPNINKQLFGVVVHGISVAPSNNLIFTIVLVVVCCCNNYSVLLYYDVHGVLASPPNASI